MKESSVLDWSMNALVPMMKGYAQRYQRYHCAINLDGLHLIYVTSAKILRIKVQPKVYTQTIVFLLYILQAF